MEALLAKLVLLRGSLGEAEALAPGWRENSRLEKLFATNIFREDG